MAALSIFSRPRSLVSPVLGYAAGTAWVLGLALQMHEAVLQTRWGYVCAGVSAALVGCLLLYGSRQPKLRWGIWRLGGACLCAALVGWGWAGWRASERMATLETTLAQPLTVQLEGVIASMVTPTEYGVRFEWSPTRWVDSPPGIGLPASPVLPRSVMVYWTGGPQADDDGAWSLQANAPALLPGDRWRLTLRIKPVHGTSNPGGFDSELWMWEQGIAAIGSVKSSGQAQLLERGWSHPVERMRQNVRDRILAHFERVPGAEIGRWAGVIAALVVGDQTAVDQSDWDLFRITGLAHLLSISGLHITMFAWAASALVGRLWRRSPRLCLAWPTPKAAAVLGWGLALAYAVFSGWALPAQRTIAMLGLAVAVRCVGLSWPWQRVWLLALVIVVAADPWAVLSPGFWLSFVAVGLLMASDASPEVLPQSPVSDYEALESAAQAPHPLVSRLKALVQIMRRSGKEQLVVSVGLAPLTLYLFQQQSVVGLLANLVAGPWMTLVVTPLGMLGVLWPPAWTIADHALALQYQVLLPMSQWPLATMGVAVAPLWLSIGGMVGAALMVVPLPWAVRIVGLPLVLAVVLWQAPRPDKGQFEVVFADVGQGNAVVVKTLSHTLVYDTGPRFSEQSDMGQRVLIPLLRSWAATPDMLVVSHQDNDHAGGAQSLLRAYPNARLVSSIALDHPLAQMRPLQRCQGGPGMEQVWQWDGVLFEVLHPLRQDYLQALPPNAMSCVLRVSNGRQTVLLLGDLEANQEDRLRVTQPEKLVADLMLVPHHGSKTSSTGVFLDAVRPRLAVVQAGYRNRYGHPAERILERYDGRGIKVVDTPHCGAMTWRSDQPNEWVCNRQVNARYWHHRPESRNVGPLYPEPAL